MKQRDTYEYKKEQYTSPSTFREEEWLNKQGAEGWELVSVHKRTPDSTRTEMLIFYFKRLILPAIFLLGAAFSVYIGL